MSQIPDDLTLISIRSAVDHLHSTINRALQRLERRVQSEHADVFSDIRKQRKLVRELGLDSRIVALYRELVRQGSFAPHDAMKECGQLLHCEIDQVAVTQSGSESKVKFRLNKHDYDLLYLDDGGGKISFYGETFSSSHLILKSQGGAELITLHLTLEGDGGNEQCTISHVTGFLPGAWIYDVIHGYETLMASRKLSSIRDQYSAQALANLKQRFGLE